jgi:glutamate/tyrosine decarboxylase-like PLP-dependent enzyme
MKAWLDPLAATLERLAPGEVQRPPGRFDPSTLDLTTSRSIDEALELCAALLTSGVHTAHPRCFGWLTPSTLPAAAVADLLVSFANPQLAVRASSPSAVAAEERLLADLAGFFGLPGCSGGTFTQGGSESNTTALVLALTARLDTFADLGLAGQVERPTFYVSSEGHKSLEKSAHAVGLGRSAMRLVPATPGFKLDVAALEERLCADRAGGFAPFAVVATAGTTNVGAVDDLSEVAELCVRHRLWLHVDAAWGGAAALSPKLSGLLSGIGRADSISFDPHKSLAMPLGTGVTLVRDGALLRRTFQPNAPYVSGPDAPSDPYCTSLAWSRRFVGLRLMLPLLLEGWGALAARFERQVELGHRLAARLRSLGYEVLFESPLAIVCFAHPTVAADALARRVCEGGRAWLSSTHVGPRAALRACITSADTTEADLEVLLEELERARRSLAEGARDAA